MRLFIAALLMIFSAGFAHAQSTLQQNLSSNKVPKLSGNTSLGYNSNFARQTSADSEQSISADLTLNYRIKDAHLLRGYLGGFKELTQGQEYKPQDGFLAWVNNRFWGNTGKFTFGQQVRLNLPLSRESRDRDTKLAGVSLVPVMMVNVSPSVLFIYQPQLTRNFSTYEENRLGNKNVEWSTQQVFVGVVSITDNLYLQPVLVYAQAWSYGGTRRDPSYQAAGEIGYSVGKGLTVATGWTNAGSIQRLQQGPDQSIEIFNNNTSTFYTSLYWVF